MTKLFEVKNLSVDFEARDGVLRAVDDLSFSLDKGETLGIVGESGSGKSVTSLAIMDLLPHNAKIQSSRMHLQGEDIRAKGKIEKIRGGKIAMIFQDPMMSLNPCYTVEYQLAETLKTHSTLGSDARKARILELLDLVGIPAAKERMKCFPHELSGGMSQRIMIAMAIACNPELLIADEPTTALDVTIQAQILRLLKEIQKKQNMGLILITHDIGVVAKNADHTLVMYAGQLVEYGESSQVLRKPYHPYTKALLGSLPNRERKFRVRLPALKGMVPNLLQRPSGCQFHPRCEFMENKCSSGAVREETISDANDRKVRCWKQEVYSC